MKHHEAPDFTLKGGLNLNSEEIKELLKKTLFSNYLSEEELDNLAAGFQVEKFKLGNIICRAGEPGEAYYIVYSGKARIVGLDSEGKESTLSTLTKGCHFGEQCLMTGENSEFTVRASGDLAVLKLDRKRFLEILERHLELKHYFEDYISDISLRNFIKQCSVFSPLDAKELRGFLDCFVSVEFNPGDYIVREGEEGDAFYIIRSGEVEVVKESLGRKLLNVLYQGQFFG